MTKLLLLGIEIGVYEHTLMVTQMHLVEVIHVELPHKGREAVVSEVFGKDGFFYFLLV